jgi:hypothetical protein
MARTQSTAERMRLTLYRELGLSTAPPDPLSEWSDQVGATQSRGRPRCTKDTTGH